MKKIGNNEDAYIHQDTDAFITGDSFITGDESS